MVVKGDVRGGHIQGISLSHSNIQHIISQHANDTSFIVKAGKSSVDNLVGILHKFELASGLEINWT